MKKLLFVLLCLYHNVVISINTTGILIVGSIVVGAYQLGHETLELIQPQKKVPVCITCGEPGKHSNTLTALSCGHAMCLICKQNKLEERWKDSFFKDICCKKLIEPLCICDKK